MLSEEERKAIEILRQNSIGRFKTNEKNQYILECIAVEDFKKILNLIQKQDNIIDKMAEEIYEHRLNNSTDFFNSKNKAKEKTSNKEQIIEYFKKVVDEDANREKH